MFQTRRHWVLVMALAFLVGLPIQGQLCSESESFSPEDSFLLDVKSLGGLAAPGEIKASMQVFGDTVFREVYQFPDSDTGILVFWLDGARKLLNHESIGLKTQGSMSVTFESSFGETVTLNGSEIWQIDRQNRDLGLAPTLPVAFESVFDTDGSGVPAYASGSGVEDKASSPFICPDPEPFCEDEYDECVNDCDFGISSCIQACEESLETCYSGDVWSTRTVQTLESYSDNGLERCGYYPWYDKFSSKRWLGFDAVYRTQVYETVHCRPTEETFEILSSDTTETKVCWWRTTISCHNGSYMGGRCRWTQPGG